MANRQFWRDICRARNGFVFFYHSTNTAIAKSSNLEGLKGFKGDLNDTMNESIVQLCRVHPLNLLALPKSFMNNHGAGALFKLKHKILQSMAENIIR